MLPWQCGNRTFDLSRHALVMGILNVTPDSFSDGGRHSTFDAALARAEQMLAEGAEILDIGGESTRPDAEPVSEEEELARVVPVVRELARRHSCPISIDTTKAAVAEACLDLGARIINDISACRFDARMIAVVRKFNAGLIAMHMQGTPKTMQLNPAYANVVAEVKEFLRERIEHFISEGIAFESIAIDPGIGFGKSHEDNLNLLRHLDVLRSLNRPVCLGVSRKGFLGAITGKPRNDRAAGSVAVACVALAEQSAEIIRVHDVAQTVDAVKVVEAIRGPKSEVSINLIEPVERVKISFHTR